MVLINYLTPTTMIKTASKVKVTLVKPHAFKSNLNQAELRQSIIKEYPARQLGNDMQSAFAPREAYKLPENTYEKERVCWVDIPEDWNQTKAQSYLNELYDKGMEPCIYQVLSHEPILTSADRSFLQNMDETEKEDFMEVKRQNQQVVNPETGEIVTRNGQVLYRKLFYSDTLKEDVDNTTVKRISAVEASNETETFQKSKAAPAAVAVEADETITF